MGLGQVTGGVVATIFFNHFFQISTCLVALPPSKFTIMMLHKAWKSLQFSDEKLAPLPSKNQETIHLLGVWLQIARSE